VAPVAKRTVDLTLPTIDRAPAQQHRVPVRSGNGRDAQGHSWEELLKKDRQAETSYEGNCESYEIKYNQSCSPIRSTEYPWELWFT
jgi:hypothetical protein